MHAIHPFFRGRRRFAALFAATWMLAASTGAGVHVGMSRADVIAEMGTPQMEFMRNGTKILAYQGLEIDIKDGVVVRVPERFESTVSRRQVRRAAEVEARAKAQAKAATRKSKRRARMPWNRSQNAPVTQHRSTGSVKVVSNGGRQVNLGSLVSRGKVTIVDFYADWCGPCRQVGPMLERLASSDPNVQLVKVDIIKWKTPVAMQYNISSIPNMRVYDRNGRLVGRPTSSYGDVVKYVKKAKS